MVNNDHNHNRLSKSLFHSLNEMVLHTVCVMQGGNRHWRQRLSRALGYAFEFSISSAIYLYVQYTMHTTPHRPREDEEKDQNSE